MPRPRRASQSASSLNCAASFQAWHPVDEKTDSETRAVLADELHAQAGTASGNAGSAVNPPLGFELDLRRSARTGRQLDRRDPKANPAAVVRQARPFAPLIFQHGLPLQSLPPGTTA